jgi:hypothetical protein
MPPILTPELHSAGSAETAGAGHGGLQKPDELVLRHFSDAHCKLAMADALAAADKACDRDIVGWVGEDEPGDLLAHQRPVARHIQGVAAEDLVLTKPPEVARFGHSWPRPVDRFDLVLRLRRLRAFNDQVDFGHFETGDSEVDNDLGQVLQFDREDLSVPTRPRRELIVREDIGALFIGAEMLDPEDRDLGHADERGGGDPAVSGNDHPGLVDQNRIEKAERLQAISNQFDLALGMGAGVARIYFEGFDRNPLDPTERRFRDANHDGPSFQNGPRVEYEQRSDADVRPIEVLQTQG